MEFRSVESSTFLVLSEALNLFSKSFGLLSQQFLFRLHFDIFSIHLCGFDFTVSTCGFCDPSCGVRSFKINYCHYSMSHGDKYIYICYQCISLYFIAPIQYLVERFYVFTSNIFMA